jgi:hypothetical protein
MYVLEYKRYYLVGGARFLPYFQRKRDQAGEKIGVADWKVG